MTCSCGSDRHQRPRPDHGRRQSRAPRPSPSRTAPIIAVGSRAAIEELKGPDTQVIDAKGGSVLPGFIEAHMHLFSGAAELAHLQLAGVHGFEALREAIRDYAADAARRQAADRRRASTIRSCGDEPVTRHHLDRILPDRPFAMAAPDHHTMWANTKALEMAGILHGRQLGPGNEIVMGDDGLAAGELRESEAFGPVLALAGEERARLGLSTGGEPDPDADRRRSAPPTATSCGAASTGAPATASPRSRTWTAISTSSNCLPEIEAEGGLLCRVQIPFHFKNFMTLDMLEKASDMAATLHSPTGCRRAWSRCSMTACSIPGRP